METEGRGALSVVCSKGKKLSSTTVEYGVHFVDKIATCQQLERWFMEAPSLSAGTI